MSSSICVLKMAASKLAAYYAALKPERTYANVMTTAAGFLFASQRHIDGRLFLVIIAGTSLIVLSACAANNFTDRELDARMPRTKRRGLVTGAVSPGVIISLAVVLGVLGFVILAAYVSSLVVILGAIGYVDYVVFYAWSKRFTPHSTLIGTVSGAVPLVAGYCAVTGRFDLTALLLGLIMVCWQMVHFYAIGVFRRTDYQASGTPVWPVVYGIRNTQYWMLAFALLYEAALIAFAVQAKTGFVFVAVSVVLGMWWLYSGFKGLRTLKPVKWAQRMFGFSLIILLTFSVALSVAPLLP